MAEEIRAEIVGSALSVTAIEGVEIAHGETLLLLESMKMEIPVVTESAGRLTRLVVSVGDTVREGDLLAVVE